LIHRNTHAAPHRAAEYREQIFSQWNTARTIKANK